MDAFFDLIRRDRGCTDLARELIKCLEPLKVKALPRHTPHLCQHADVCTANRHDDAGRNDHNVHMARAIRTADEFDRPFHTADFRAGHQHTLSDIDGALKDMVDVDSCSFVDHNEHSYSMTRCNCHLHSEKTTHFISAKKNAACNPAAFIGCLIPDSLFSFHVH